MAAGSVNSGLTPAAYRLRRIIFFPAPIAGQIMKIGTLLTTAIVSLSTVGGGLAVYVAVTKYQTMDRIAEAQGRLAIVRAVSDIPRYLNPERGFATNILYGPATVDPAQLTEHDKLRKQTDGARDRMNALRKELPGPFDDGATIGSNIDAINSKFTALREAIDKAIAGPADARKDAAKKIVADNAVLNAGVTALLNEQVRRMAILNGDAYRQANYANIAMTLRDVGGLNSSVHKNLVGAKKVANDAEKADMARIAGPQRPDRDVADGIARQSGNAGQRRRGAGDDERELCRGIRPRDEARQGRRRQRQIRARCRDLLRGVAEGPRLHHRRPRRLLRQCRADPRRRYPPPRAPASRSHSPASSPC